MRKKEKREKRDKKIIVWVTPAEKKDFQNKCTGNNLTMSEGGRQLIENDKDGGDNE